jgi:hypothetical protein
MAQKYPMFAGQQAPGMPIWNNQGNRPLQGRRGAPNEWRQYSNKSGQEFWNYSAQDARWSRDDHLRRQSHLANQQAQVNAGPVPIRPHQPGFAHGNSYRDGCSAALDPGTALHGGRHIPPCTTSATTFSAQEQQRFQQGLNHTGNAPEGTRPPSSPFHNAIWAQSWTMGALTTIAANSVENWPSMLHTTPQLR